MRKTCIQGNIIKKSDKNLDTYFKIQGIDSHVSSLQVIRLPALLLD